ncbi:hypothetical protein PR048_021596 [Dryococelus australis]|uniref:Uncharacterized protein n=1 Tax=Dryococelus australis TaxID=614101 RepID=A0ABQ9GYP2_9NEOP|nr:hypothetical protein PR048_021596 [Dryococelus australis]
MTELLHEQTRLYEQLTSRGICGVTTLPPDVVSLHSSLKPQTDVPRLNHCCCSKQIISVVREEHGRLEQLIKKNTNELTEIRHLLCELLSKNNDSLSQTQKHL